MDIDLDLTSVAGALNIVGGGYASDGREIIIKVNGGPIVLTQFAYWCNKTTGYFT